MTGVKPTPRDPRDRKYHHARLFGAATSFPDEYNADIGLSMPNQDADNRPSECTAYTTTELAQNEDARAYAHDYSFMKTLETEGVAPDSNGADARTAFKMGSVFGFLPVDSAPTGMAQANQTYAATQANWPLTLDAVALNYKKPIYSPVSPAIGQDWTDAVRSALWLGKEQKKLVGVGTQWSPEFEVGEGAGILPDTPHLLGWGHMYAIVGWKQLNGQLYLIAKTWQGKNYGDNGYCYMSRALFNSLMGTWGTYAATYEVISKLDATNLREEQISILQVIVAFLENLVQLKFHP